MSRPAPLQPESIPVPQSVRQSVQQPLPQQQPESLEHFGEEHSEETEAPQPEQGHIFETIQIELPSSAHPIAHRPPSRTDAWPCVPSANPIAHRPSSRTGAWPCAPSAPSAPSANPIAHRPSSPPIHFKLQLRDVDPQRLQQTYALLTQLAPRLGLNLETICLRVDETAAQQTTAYNARGLVAGGAVYLHPQQYHPQRSEGRYLLAHEVTHLAQQVAYQTAQRSSEPSALAPVMAELEADEIGQAFAVGTGFARPVALLAVTDTAADVGDRVSLKAVVERSRKRELNAIRKILKEGTQFLFWTWISDRDVEKILRILEPLPFVTMQGIVAVLTSKERVRLVDEITDIGTSLYRRYRSAILAAYGALEEDEVKQFNHTLLEKLDLTGLTDEERDATLRTIRRLDAQSRKQLVKLKNASVILSLLQLPAPDEEGLKQQREAVLESEQEREATATALAAKYDQDDETQKILAEINEITSGRRFNAVAVLDRLIKIHTDQEKFRYVAEQLEEKGILDRLIDKLPEPARYQPPARRDTFMLLLKFRPVEKNLELAEDLLSYGVFDWAVRDHEARFAYHLIKQLPLAAQYRFRQIEDGKWFRRLESNVQANLIKTGEYQGIEVRWETVDGKQQLVDVASEYAQTVAKGDGKQLLDELFQLAEQGIDTKTAEAMHQRLAVIGNATQDKDADLKLREAIVRRLDTLGYIGQMFDRLPDTFIYAEVNRAATIKIMMARDPIHVAAHAKSLLSLGFFDWAVTAQEAYLAYQMVRALPDAEREAFIASDGGERWAKILGEMTAEMRQSKDLNLYVGSKGGLDKATVQAQLLEDSLWTDQRMAQLSGLIRMAIAMGEHQWLFEESKKRYSAASPTLREQVFEKYKLYLKGKRDEYAPHDLKGTSYWEEGPFQTLKTIVSGLIFYFSNHLYISPRTITGKDLDLVQLQGVLGGDISGVQLAASQNQAQNQGQNQAQNQGQNQAQNQGQNQANNTSQNPSAPGEQAKAEKTANTVDVRWDVGQGVLEVDLPELQIESINLHQAGFNFQSGKASLSDLKIRASYGPDDFKEATFLRLDSAQLTLTDVLVIFRSSMLAINQVSVDALHVQGGLKDTTTTDPSPPRQGPYFPVPVFGYIFGFFRNLFKLAGWSPAKYATFGLVDHPKAASTELAEGLAGLKSLELSFGNLKIEGFTTSGGQQIAALEIQDFQMRAAGTKGAYLRHLIASLNQRITAQQQQPTADAATLEALQTRLTQATQALEKVLPVERELLRLERQYQQDPSGFSDTNHRRLLELQADLKGGLVLDVGDIRASGITGTVNLEDIKLSDLHGEGESAALALPFLTDQAIVEQFSQQGSPQSKQQQAGDSAFKLEISAIKTQNLSVQRAIPTSEELEQQLQALAAHPDDPKVALQIAELTAFYNQVKQYERYAARGIGNLSAQEQQQFLKLRQDLQSVALRIAAIELTGTTLDVNAATGAVGVGAKALRIDRLETINKLKQQQAVIDQVIGKEIQISAGLNGGVKALLDPLRNLKSAGVKAESLDLEGIHLGQAGAEIKKLAFAGVDSNIEIKPAGTQKQTSARLKATSIQAEGISLIVTAEILNAQLANLKAIPEADRSEADTQKITEIEAALSMLQDLNDLLTEDRIKLEAARGTAQEAEAAKVVAADEALLEQFQQQLMVQGLAITDLDLAITGLGDVLSEGYDWQQNLQAGIHLEGKGQGQQMFSSLTLTESRIPGLSGQKVELGATGGNVDYSQSEIKLTDFYLQSVAATGIDWIAGSHAVQAPGTTRLTDLQITGSIQKQARQDKTGHEVWALSRVHINRLRVAAVAAEKLTYFGDDLIVEVELGELGGLEVTDLVVDLPQTGDTQITQGTISAQKLDHLKLAGVLKGGLSGSATLNGSGLSVQFVSADQRIFKVAELSAQVEGQDKSGNKLRVSVRKLSGTVIQEGDNFKIENVRVATVTIGKSRWSGSGTTIEINGEATLKEITLGAEVIRQRQGDQVKFKNLKVNWLRIKEIEAKNIHVALEASAADPTSKPMDFTLPEGKITNLEVKGFDLLAQRGDIDLEAADLKDLEVKIGEAGKESIKAKVSIQGAELGATLAGPDRTIVVGSVQNVSGTLTAGGATIDKFSLNQLILNVDIGEDYVSIFDLKLGPANLNNITYQTETGGQIKLATAKIKEVHLRNLRAEWAMVDGERKLAAVKIAGLDSAEDGLVLNEVVADGFKYTGSVTARNASGRIVTSETEINAQQATLDPVRFHAIELNYLTDITKINAEIGKVDVQGFAAAFMDKVAGRLAKETRFAADITAEAIQADLTLNHVLGSVDKTAPVTTDGKFHLDRFVLKTADYALTTGSIDTGFKQDTQGIAITETSVGNLTFKDDKHGIQIDIQKASLPKGVDIPKAKPVTIPKLDIMEAHLLIKDVMNIGGGGSSSGSASGSSAGSSSPLLKNYSFLNTLEGHVNADLDFNLDFAELIYLDIYPERTVPLRLNIQAGKINFADLESRTLSAITPVLEFEVDDDDNTLTLEVDFPLMAGIANLADRDLVVWDLSPEELELAEQDEVRISTLIEKKRSASGGGGGGSGNLIERLAFQNVDADLSLRGSSVIDLGSTGRIRLGGDGKDGLLHLTAKGSSTSKTGIALGLQEANVTVEALNLGGVGIKTGLIQIQNFHDAALQFKGGWTPTQLEGTIGKATAENIEITSK